ncbi:unnamed protein product, partial [Didymodactylos carnosus]
LFAQMALDNDKCKRNICTITDDDDNVSAKRKDNKIPFNEIPDIETEILSLTSTVVNEIIALYICFIDGDIDSLLLEKRLNKLLVICPSLLLYSRIEYEWRYDDENLLKKLLYIVSSIIINVQYRKFFDQNSKLAKSNLRNLLHLIIQNNVFQNFENMSEPINSSAYFSLVVTILIPIISHKQVSVQDLQFFGTILSDSIVTKNVDNWAILKNVIELFQNANKLDDNAIIFAGIIIILLHEFFHILRRTLIKPAYCPFYHRTPKRKISLRGDIEMDEGGFQLEDRLFGFIYNTVGFKDANYLLNINKWRIVSHDKFKRRLLDVQLSDVQENADSNRLVLPCRGQSMEVKYDTKNTKVESDSMSPPIQRLDLKRCGVSYCRIDT